MFKSLVKVGLVLGLILGLNGCGDKKADLDEKVSFSMYINNLSYNLSQLDEELKIDNTSYQLKKYEEIKSELNEFKTKIDTLSGEEKSLILFDNVENAKENYFKHTFPNNLEKFVLSMIENKMNLLDVYDSFEKKLSQYNFSNICENKIFKQSYLKNLNRNEIMEYANFENSNKDAIIFKSCPNLSKNIKYFK